MEGTTELMDSLNTFADPQREECDPVWRHRAYLEYLILDTNEFGDPRLRLDTSTLQNSAIPFAASA